MARDQGAGGGVSPPILALIAAVGRNGAIGADNALPWRLSSDLKRFKALTMGKPVVVGRKTFVSMGRPLPGRRMIVVTHNKTWTHPGVEVAHDIDAAVALLAGAEEAFVAGGGEIYEQTIAQANRLYITEVDLAPEGDTRFPPIDPTLWRETKREKGVRDARDEADFVFVEYERRS